jgi:hypothetical protein
MAPRDQSPSRSDRIQNSPDTTQKHSHACRTDPTHSAAYHQQGVSCGPRFPGRGTTRNRPVERHCHQNCTSWLSPHGTHTFQTFANPAPDRRRIDRFAVRTAVNYVFAGVVETDRGLLSVHKIPPEQSATIRNESHSCLEDIYGFQTVTKLVRSCAETGRVCRNGENH